MISTSHEVIEALVDALPVISKGPSAEGQFRDNVRGQLRGVLAVSLGDPDAGTPFSPEDAQRVKGTIEEFAQSPRFRPEHDEFTREQLKPVLARLDQLAQEGFVVRRQNRLRSAVSRLLRS